MKKPFFLLSLLLLPLLGAAQKLGYTNSLALLAEMPEAAAADSLILSMRDSLVKTGESQALALQTKYNDYVNRANEGSLTPVEMQSIEAELQQEQEALTKLEEEILLALDTKRQELFTPLLQALQTAIDAVGKENGYLFIFDTSAANFILFAEESDDVTLLVKAKLNL